MSNAALDRETIEAVRRVVADRGHDATLQCLLTTTVGFGFYPRTPRPEASVNRQLSVVLSDGAERHLFTPRWRQIFRGLARLAPPPSEVPPSGMVHLSYGGVSIFGDATRGLVNLTQMWRAAGSPPGREPARWARTDQAQRLIERVRVRYPDLDNEVFHTVRGGNGPQGTWAHWQIGLAYAHYLDPDFYLWSNEELRTSLTSRTREAQEFREWGLRMMGRLEAVERVLHITPEQIREERTREAPIETQGEEPPTLPPKTQINIIVRAEGLRRQDAGETEPFKSAWLYLYHLAEEQPWGRGIRRTHRPDSILSAFEEAGRLVQLLHLVIRAYPEAYQSVRGRLGPIEVVDPAAAEAYRQWEADQGTATV